MLENADITIYHKWETGYTPIQIKNVCMRGRQESGFTGQNTSSSDEYTIRIYAAADTGKKEYICAKKYSLLTDPTNHWTVSAGDYIVTGIADSSIKTPAELTRTYSDVYRVISVSDYRVSDSKVSDVDHIKVVVKK
ncbi:MAG: DUF6751 family protein [Acutalibacteraceae bacterium]|nr:DUF6751 family protein [Acutalibacteraceae bacterium]